MVDPRALGFHDTSDVTPLDDTIGQGRAVEALEFGLRMQSAGFNIYVSGPTGTGKTSLVQDMVRRLAKAAKTPVDWCYVNNFRDASKPGCLAFPPSQGRAFKHAMATLIQSLQRDIPAAFESRAYVEAKARHLEETEAKKKKLFKELTELGRTRGFMLEDTPIGFTLIPVRNGKPMKEKEFAALSEEERQEFNTRRAQVESEFREFHVRLHVLDHEAEQRVRDLDQQVVTTVLERHITRLAETYRDLPDVLDYLRSVRDDVLANHKDFLSSEVPHLPAPLIEPGVRRPDLTRYHVNVIVEHAPDAGAPVVVEPHPTYSNLIGKMERKAHLGIIYTDFMEIKAGALLQASGGYLILNAMDLLRQPFAWDAVKRAIKTREVKIEDPGEFYGLSTASLRPQPIPIDVKVILLGPPQIYHLLQAYEEDFMKIFKVKADFDVDVARDPEQDARYARFVSRLCRDEGLPPFTAEAVARVITQGLRLAERRDRLSLRLSLLSDLIREAGFWAQRAGRPLVEAADVETAVAKRRHRANLPEEWLQDEIKDGTLIVDLDGEVIGQVNGLSVHTTGDYTFGRPCRITARTFVGTKGVIDIQREAELAGRVHSKGVMILAGYLAGKFAPAHPFAVSATLTFEQTYSEVEGDSASAAELVAVLSSLADLPVRQSLAITGSVNQLGDMQPIGGVNEKIEGFFDSCRARGLSGRHGVVIPARNLKHLVLRRDVVEAVESGRFRIYGVNTIDEAVELLTGVPAGEAGADGRFPEDSVFGRVQRRLREMADAVAAHREATVQEDGGHADV